jgi:hypothetical protein
MEKGISKPASTLAQKIEKKNNSKEFKDPQHGG